MPKSSATARSAETDNGVQVGAEDAPDVQNDKVNIEAPIVSTDTTKPQPVAETVSDEQAALPDSNGVQEVPVVLEETDDAVSNEPDAPAETDEHKEDVEKFGELADTNPAPHVIEENAPSADVHGTKTDEGNYIYADPNKQ